MLLLRLWPNIQVEKLRWNFSGSSGTYLYHEPELSNQNPPLSTSFDIEVRALAALVADKFQSVHLAGQVRGFITGDTTVHAVYPPSQQSFTPNGVY